ncbi:MAG TPA: glutathione S-transferase N-terminal domain-containing protein [Burkholderiales bacterium]|nr:glutathione S-transferase N-terminal domain-containing protein [Burkholderiales bacterium]
MIQLWELRGKGGRLYSMFSWRTKLALKHKQLDYESRPVVMSDKQTIAFSGGKTVPIIKDGDRVVRDSWKIAEYLEDQYPDRPSLFGGDTGRGLTQAFNTWADRMLLPVLMPVLVADLHERVDAADDQYFRTQFEGFLKSTLEEARAKRQEFANRFNRQLEPWHAVVKRQNFVCGNAPAYGDYILFSLLQWARIASPQDVLEPGSPLDGWRTRMLDLYDGFARKVSTA